MISQSRKFLFGIIAALLIASVPLITQASSSDKQLLENQIRAYAAHEEDEEDFDDIISLPDNEPEFDAAAYISLQKDFIVSMEQMGGVLDRYSGSGFPEHCDEFTSYYLAIALLSIGFIFQPTPDDWFDISELTLAANIDVLDGTAPVAELCTNGGRGSLSEHNRFAARASISRNIDKMHIAVRAAEDRSGTTGESTLEQILADAPTRDEIVEEFGADDFDAIFFYADTLISAEIMQEIGGWYDRILAGSSEQCGELLFLFDELSQPFIALFVPPEWEPLYMGHLNAILTVLDTSEPVLLSCIEEKQPTRTQIENARYGVTLGLNQLYPIIQATEDRLGADSINN